MFKAVHSVFMFVENIEQSRDWYASVLDRKPTYIDEKFAMFKIGEINLCFHQADSKTPVSSGGSVTYWWVDDFEKALSDILKAGGSVYRGSIESEPGARICQIKDPFGNVFGIEGQAASF